MSRVGKIIRMCKALFKGPEWKSKTLLPGWNERITPRGVKVVELDVEADPEKRDPRFLEEAARRQRNIREFRREYLRDRTSAAGNAVYPEFSDNGGIAYYCQDLPGFIKGQPVYRGWDFGLNCPPCTFVQVSPETGRVYVLREIVLKRIHTPTMANVVRFASGQIDESALDSHEKERIAQMRMDPSIPPMPWFPPGTLFMDYAGPECFRKTADISADAEETNSFEILAAKGIHLIAPRVSPHWRISLIRNLLLGEAKDGGPMIVIDISCRFVIGLFLGLLSYPKATMLRPHPNKPRKDGTYDDVHDSLGYVLINVKPLIETPSGANAAPPEADQKLPWVENEDVLMRALPRASEVEGADESD